MMNENRNMLSSGNINNQHLNDGNKSKLIEEPGMTLTKELFLCRICYNYDQIERFVSAILHVIQVYCGNIVKFQD